MSLLKIIGFGLVAFSAGGTLIKTNRFVKTRHMNGLTTIKDKWTGVEIIQNSKGFMTKL